MIIGESVRQCQFFISAFFRTIEDSQDCPAWHRAV